MAEFLKVGKADKLTPGQARRVEVNGKRLALFNVEGSFYALDDTCTHKGGPLSKGMIEGDHVTCPWHKAKFSIRTGEVVGPPARQAVASYRARLTGIDIEIEV